MIVREMLVRFGISVSPEFNNLPGRIANVERSANNAANAFRGMLSAFVGFSALKNIINTADEMQSLQARIGALPQTVGSASAAFDEVGQHALAAGASVQAYATLYARIGQAARDVIPDQKELLNVVDTISKAVATGGASATEQKSAFYQLSQAFNVGKLQGNDLHALRTAAPDFVRSIGDALGYTGEKFAEAAKGGKVTTDQLVKAIDKIGPMFDARFNKLPFSFGRAFTIMEGRYALFINKLNNESGAVPAIARIFANFFDGLFDGLNTLVDKLDGGGQALKIFGILVASALAPSTVQIFIAAIRAMLSPMVLWIASIFLVGLAINDLYTYLNGGDSVFGRWLGAVRNADGSLNILNASIAGLIVTLGILAVVAPLSTLTLLGMAFGNLSYLIVINIIRLQSEIALYSGLALVWLSEVIPAAYASATAFLAMSVSAFGITLPLYAIIGIVLLIIGVIYLLYKAFTGTFSDITDVANRSWTSIKDGFMSMVDAIKDYWVKFKSFWGLSSSLNVDAQTTASAATAPGGVPTNNGGAPINVTVNQTLPPGTPQETADRANSSTKDAIDSFFGLGPVARQMGQVAQ